jgi:PAS domain S-box-containing protein
MVYVVYVVAWWLFDWLVRSKQLDFQYAPLLEVIGTVILIIGAVYVGMLIGFRKGQDSIPQPAPTTEHLQARYEALQAAFERQTRTAALLDSVRMAISRELDLQMIIRTVVEGVAEVFGYTHISLYLLEQDDLILQYQIGYDNVIERVPLSKGVAGRVVRNGFPVLIEDVSKDAEFLGAVGGIVSEIAVPLYDQYKVVGLFNVESVNGVKLTEADLDLMIALSDHIDIALSRARLYEEIRRNEETFRQIFTHAPISMVLSDMNAKVVRVNPATCKLLGYEEQELIGMNLSDIAYPDDDPKNIELRQELLKGRMTYFTMEKRYFAKSGAMIYGILQVAMIRDAQGNPVQFVGQIVDATELKQAEHKLQTLNQVLQSLNTTLQTLNLELEQRVEERTKELSAANQRLIELDKLKTKFIGDISHELRTPLANINTRLYLLDHDKPDRTPDHLTIIKTQMSRLQMLLDDVLNFARLESIEKQSIFLEPININTLIETLKPTYAARAHAAKLELSFVLRPEPLMIQGSDEHLIKLFTNLLENAIKYTPSGYIKVRTYEATTGQRAVIEVSDSGRGILPEDLPHIFERFYRGHDIGSSNIPGTGLGLAIVKEIVVLHHGEIEVASIPAKGTKFFVYLPLVNTLQAGK